MKNTEALLPDLAARWHLHIHAGGATLCGRYDRTPLMYAAASDSLPVIKAFMARNDLELFARDKPARMAVHFAAQVSPRRRCVECVHCGSCIAV